ncbi:MAG: hypothetical protein JJU02_10275 [Cryomorphaceae bacterium]|nr:hypothetical protein [Cryomorphaceae bacterium]
MKLKIVNKIILGLFIISCTNETEKPNVSNKEEDERQVITAEKRFVNPPIKNLNIPFEDFAISAKTGGELKFKTGSKVYFPPNAFLDKDGNILEGEIQIAFREFLNPVDFFVAGIPMEYDTLNETFTFESSGMCEINAFKNNEPVFVNPENKPLISLSSKNDDSSHNLYYLDTIQEKWIVKGKSEIKTTNIPEEVEPEIMEMAYLSDMENPPPVKPKKANLEMPNFTVEIPDVDFIPELKIFKNTRFEIDKSEKNYDPKEADYEWDMVSLDKTDNRDVYLITFSTRTRKVSYKVRPVYEGKDFTEAMELYQTAKEEYEAERKEVLEKFNKAEKLRKIAREITRPFEIEQFGIWNCDRIIRNDRTFNINVVFKDKNDVKIAFSIFYLVQRETNALFSCHSTNITLTPSFAHAFWGIRDEKLYYFTYSDYENADINANKNEYTFVMKEHDLFVGEDEGNPGSSEQLLKLLEI